MLETLMPIMAVVSSNNGLPRPQEGKSGGYRSIILYRQSEKAFFVYGFAKNVMENIDKADVRAFKKLARVMLSVTEKQVEILLVKGEIEEMQS